MIVDESRLRGDGLSEAALGEVDGFMAKVTQMIEDVKAHSRALRGD